MQKKICPICDHVMKRAHFCSFCKQWISNPNIINATYHLNERHSPNERDCEYHAPSFMKANQNSSSTVRRTKAGRPGSASRQAPASGNRSGNTAARTWQNRNSGRPAAKSAKAGSYSFKNIVMIIVLIWVFLTCVSGLLPFLFFFL